MPHLIPPPPSPLYALAHLPAASRDAFRILTFKGTVKELRKWIKMLINKKI